MKKTIREFGVCQKCEGFGRIETPEQKFKNFKFKLEIPLKCPVCDGTGGILIKETIEESDDMKEFIEKKCGWKLEEGGAFPAPFIPGQNGSSLGMKKILEENARNTRNTAGLDYCCTGCSCDKPRCMVAHDKTSNEF